jgi:hypothetical protein
LKGCLQPGIIPGCKPFIGKEFGEALVGVPHDASQHIFEVFLGVVRDAVIYLFILGGTLLSVYLLYLGRDAVIYLFIESIISFNISGSDFRIFSPRLEAKLTPVGPRWRNLPTSLPV